MVHKAIRVRIKHQPYTTVILSKQQPMHLRIPSDEWKQTAVQLHKTGLAVALIVLTTKIKYLPPMALSSHHPRYTYTWQQSFGGNTIEFAHALQVG